ncbi:hypothetical protein CSKR_101725 [Clonorchis sinensis]|uniref:Uncharacterized protein n=1 Tax=Clonorchis sinensis TaxID=79923 RepID=A0A419PHB7_CLOSI|nr:hypothetical protein CSKR_101725 [Clonorchis sinensis]
MSPKKGETGRGLPKSGPTEYLTATLEHNLPWSKHKDGQVLLGQPGRIPALVLLSGGMAVKHRMLQLNEFFAFSARHYPYNTLQWRDSSEVHSKTIICVSFTKLNIHLLLERVFLSFPGYSLTVTQMQVNATNRLHKFRKRSHFSRVAKRMYEKTYYSHASSAVSTVTPIFCSMIVVHPSR